MKQNWNLLFYALLIVMFVACSKDKQGFTKTDSGLMYKFIEKNEGSKPQLGDIMIMDILYLTDKDSILFDSKTKQDSFTVVLVAPTFTGGVEEGFAMMSTGDSALFKSSADSIFEKTFHTTLPAYMKKGSHITFRVRLKSFISKSVVDSIKSSTDIESRKKEFEKIEAYLSANNMDVMPTENGVYMVVTKSGSGQNPVKGDTVFVNYTGRLLDGNIFDQAVNREAPFHFVLGQNKVIPGWEESIPLLRKGAVAKMVIPSDLGFGADKYGKLPGYSTLVFEIEIIDIKTGE